MAARIINLPIMKDKRLGPLIDKIAAKILSTSENSFKCGSMLQDFFAKVALVQVLYTAQSSGEIAMSNQSLPYAARDNQSTGFATVDEVMACLATDPV